MAMPASKRTDLIAINLRLPKSLHKSLKQQAKRKGVPLNTEIVNMLEGYEAKTVKRSAEIFEPMIKASSGAAVIVGEMVVRTLKPEALEEFKAAMLKAGVQSPSPKIRDDDEGEREKE
jgi:hypothetical protein